MTNQELYQEENRQLLKSIASGIDEFKKVLQGQIDITVNQPDKITVNTEKSVEVTNLEQMKEWVDSLGTVVTKAIEDNSYKPISEVSIKNTKDILPSKLTISNLSDIKEYFSDITRAIKDNQPIVNITKQNIVFPRSPKDAIPVRLSDGKGFYNAITAAISSSNGSAHLYVGGTAVSASNPVPVDIQDASLTINGDVTISSEVEVKNDSGNPVPVNGTVAVTGVSTSTKQDTIIGHLDGVETLLGTIDADTGNIATEVAGLLTDTELRATPVPVLGTVTANLAAGTNNIGDVDVLTLPVAFNAGTVSATTQRVQKATGATSTQTQVADSASSQTILAANTGRIKAVIVNDSTATLYLRESATAATTSVYTYKMYPDETVIIDDYNGALTGIWSANASGNAIVTETTA